MVNILRTIVCIFIIGLSACSIHTLGMKYEPPIDRHYYFMFEKSPNECTSRLGAYTFVIYNRNYTHDNNAQNFETFKKLIRGIRTLSLDLPPSEELEREEDSYTKSIHAFMFPVKNEEHSDNEEDNYINTSLYDVEKSMEIFQIIKRSSAEECIRNAAYSPGPFLITYKSRDYQNSDDLLLFVDLTHIHSSQVRGLLNCYIETFDQNIDNNEIEYDVLMLRIRSLFARFGESLHYFLIG